MAGRGSPSTPRPDRGDDPLGEQSAERRGHADTPAHASAYGHVIRSSPGLRGTSPDADLPRTRRAACGRRGRRGCRRRTGRLPDPVRRLAVRPWSSDTGWPAGSPSADPARSAAPPSGGGARGPERRRDRRPGGGDDAEGPLAGHLGLGGRRGRRRARARRRAARAARTTSRIGSLVPGEPVGRQLTGQVGEIDAAHDVDGTDDRSFSASDDPSSMSNSYADGHAPPPRPRAPPPRRPRRRRHRGHVRPGGHPPRLHPVGRQPADRRPRTARRRRRCSTARAGPARSS